MSRRSGTSDGRIKPEPISPDVLAVIRGTTDPAAVAREVIIAGLQSTVTYYDSEMPAREADAILAALAAAGHTLAQPGQVAVPRRTINACSLLVEMVSDQQDDETVTEIVEETMHYVRANDDYTGDTDSFDTVLDDLRAALGAGAATGEGEDK